MTQAPRGLRWELPAALVAAALCFVPYLRIPAGFLLLAVLPGLAIARHRLGERSAARAVILSAPLSLAAVAAVAIPISLALGRPTLPLAAAAAAIVTAIASWRPRPALAEAIGRPSLNLRHLATIAVLALLLQGAATWIKHPDADTVRWRGLPDYFFFQGIYGQIAERTPPLDPERGEALLVHNWIYHFHFALIEIATGVPVWAMQRIVSAWMALALLGAAYLVASDTLRSPAGGLVASLFIMTAGEVNWVLRLFGPLGRMGPLMRWEDGPFGVGLLFGWYNLAPIVAALTAWWAVERHRESGSTPHLVLSQSMCVALAFFHPVFYAVFMTAFCLWLGTLWLREGIRPAWLLFLATPVPFFLLYKLPYYGLAMPPSVAHPDLSPRGVLTRGASLILWTGLVLAAGAAGTWILGRRGGPLAWIVALSIALVLLVQVPNPHWFKDLYYVALSLAAGAAIAAWAGRSRALAAAVLGAALIIGGTSFVLQARRALSAEHVFEAGERSGAAWLRAHAGRDDLIAILPNSPSSYPILGLADRRLVHGWTNHLMDFHHDSRERERLVTELFTTADPSRATEIARGVGARYLWVGAYERRQGGAAGLSGTCFREVFAEEPVSILEFICRADGTSPAIARSPRA